MAKKTTTQTRVAAAETPAGHPVRTQNGFNGDGELPILPCDTCQAQCCHYFALQIDTPEDEEDFENIKWYICHKNTFVFVDDDDWYLQINQPCVHIGEHYECTIYDRRPQICREHGYNEDNEPNCEYFHDYEKEAIHDAEYHTIEDIEKLMDELFSDEEEEFVILEPEKKGKGKGKKKKDKGKKKGKRGKKKGKKKKK